MRKFLTFLAAMLISITAINAKTLYLVPNDNWKKDKAWFAVYSFGSGDKWTAMSDAGNGMYSATVDDKYPNAIFCRMDPNSQNLNWDNKWNQTNDLSVPADKNCYTIAEGAWDKGNGTWSQYDAPVPTEPTVSDITITGDKYVNTELTFTATVAGFSADPMIIYEVKAGEGEYVEAQGGKFTPTAAGKYTVKATATYQSEEAFKEVDFTVTEAPKVGIVVNVTVPAGTPACYFYGEMSGNTFVAMTKVDETHYTLEFPTATTIGWGYKFCWENGNWATNNSDPAGDIKVEPVNGVIDVEVKAWATNPGTEYKYTTYTEWQVKYGPKWDWLTMTKQEDGTFTIDAVWGNTGINIASGDNPIKQDWYPLGDAALTVEQGVAEGDNVVITLTVVNDNTVALHVAKGEGPTPVETAYYLVGDYCGWKFDTTAIKAFELYKDDTLFVKVDSLFGEIKVTEGKGWDKSFGAWNEVYQLYVGASPYGMLAGNESKNFSFDADYKDAIFYLYWADKEGQEGVKELMLHFVSGTKVEKPVTYYLKNNWNGGEWGWKAMKSAEEGYVLDRVIFGGTGVNLNTKESDDKAVWFDLKALKYNETDTIQALDTVRFELSISEKDTVLKAILLGRPEPEVKAYYLVGDYCGWKFDTTAIKAFELYKDDTLFVKVDSLFGEIKVTEGKGWDKSFGAWNEVYQLHAGASPYGMLAGNESKNFSFDADYKDAIFYLYWADKEGQEGVKELMLHFVSGTKVEQPVKYYAKNNWDKAAEWSWLEMSATDKENVYMLDNVVFGGTGVNINDKEDDATAIWFAVDKIRVLDGLDGFPAPIPPDPRKRDTLIWAPARMGAGLEAPQLLAGDTIKLFFNAADSTLSAAIVGRPEPVETKYYITGNEALCGEKAWNPTAIEMENGTHTFMAMAAGEYEMKITNGAWDPEGQSWGSADLSENCSAGVGDKNGNIHFIVETPNNVVVTIAEGKVTVTGTFKQDGPTPVEEGFGIILSDETTIKGQKNEAQLDFLEYIIEANLTAGATFQLYDFANKAAWTETNMDQSSTPNVYINTDNVYEATSNGKYTIYLKMYGPENNQVYIAYDGTGTSLETIMLNGGLKKFILDGQMYILRNNHLFNAAGTLLK